MLSRFSVGGKHTRLSWADCDGDCLFSGHYLDVFVSRFDFRRGNGTVETLESHRSAHADEVARNIFIPFWDFSSTKNSGVVPNSTRGTQLSNLTIVHECCYDIGQDVA